MLQHQIKNHHQIQYLTYKNAHVSVYYTYYRYRYRYKVEDRKGRYEMSRQSWTFSFLLFPFFSIAYIFFFFSVVVVVVAVTVVVVVVYFCHLYIIVFPFSIHTYLIFDLCTHNLFFIYALSVSHRPDPFSRFAIIEYMFVPKKGNVPKPWVWVFVSHFD